MYTFPLVAPSLKLVPPPPPPHPSVEQQLRVRVAELEARERELVAEVARLRVT